MSGLQNRLNESCRRCVLAPGTQLAPGAERVVARATKVDLQISTDFWKAQTMLFHGYGNENLRTYLL